MIEELDINYDAAAEKLKENIIQQIESGNHIRTGNLRDSIECSADDDGISMEAEEYYQYLDEKYDISEDAVNDDLIDFMSDDIGTQMEEELGNSLQQELN
jgi:hypothetical protein